MIDAYWQEWNAKIEAKKAKKSKRKNAKKSGEKVTVLPLRHRQG